MICLFDDPPLPIGGAEMDSLGPDAIHLARSGGFVPSLRFDLVVAYLYELYLTFSNVQRDRSWTYII
jgi:hypothetical protein